MSGKTNGKARKILGSLVVVGVLGGLVGLGAFSAFTATTTNSGNTITSGTVAIGQHSGAATLYNVTNQKPGDSTQKCIRVTYTGSLASKVHIYTPSVITNGSLYNITVERGSGMTTLDNTMSCAGFTSASTAYAANTLTNFATNTSYASSSIFGKAADANWATNDAVDYRFTITQNDDTTANAHTSATSSGAMSVVWEAQNQ